jgi:hypothetical protein
MMEYICICDNYFSGRNSHSLIYHLRLVNSSTVIYFFYHSIPTGHHNTNMEKKTDCDLGECPLIVAGVTYNIESLGLIYDI